MYWHEQRDEDEDTCSPDTHRRLAHLQSTDPVYTISMPVFVRDRLAACAAVFPGGISAFRQHVVAVVGDERVVAPLEGLW